MAFNFPVAPTLNQVYTSPEGLVFTFNGYGWLAQAAGGGGGGTPVDAYTKQESDDRFVNVPGDTMTGGLSNNVWVESPLFLTPLDNDNACFVCNHPTAPLIGQSAFHFTTGLPGAELARFTVNPNGMVFVNPEQGGSPTNSSPNTSFSLHVNKASSYGGVLVNSDVGTSGPNISAMVGASQVFTVDTPGQIWSTSTTIGALSDASYKEGIAPMQYGLGDILQLNPITYRLIDDPADAPLRYGFTAQEVQPIFPELVRATEHLGREGEMPLALFESSLLVPLVKAVQELAARVATLEATP